MLLAYLDDDEKLSRLDKDIRDGFREYKSKLPFFPMDIHGFNRRIPDLLGQIMQKGNYELKLLKLLRVKYQHDLFEAIHLKFFLAGFFTLLGFCSSQIISSFIATNGDTDSSGAIWILWPYVIPAVTWLLLGLWVKWNDETKHCLRAVSLYLFHLNESH